MTEQQKSSIGRRIKELRKAKGITQDGLGEAVGISSKYLSSIERGQENPTLDTLLRIATELRVQPYELFLFGPAAESSKVLRKELDRMLDRIDSQQLQAILELLKDRPRQQNS